MVINKYRITVQLYFKPPIDCPGEWDGYEKHEEEIYASDKDLAARAMKTMVNRRIGQQKGRLAYIDISDPELVPER